jgi:hypothetical protein
LRLLESFENGPLQTTVREAAIAAFDLAVVAAADAAGAARLAGSAGAWPGAPLGVDTAPGIGCAICDGESWSSALRFGSCGFTCRCCADGELASVMTKPATTTAPIKYLRIWNSLSNPRIA